MRVFRRFYTGRDGKKQQARDYYLDFRDTLGRRHIVRGFAEKRGAMALGDTIKALMSCAGIGQQPDAELQRKVDLLPLRIKKNFTSWGLLSRQRAAGGKLLSEHLADWQQSLLAGVTIKHADLQFKRVKRVFGDCGFRTWADISASKVQHKISLLKKEVYKKTDQGVLPVETEAATTKKQNYYLQACQQFFRWALLDGRIVSNPLAHLKQKKA